MSQTEPKFPPPWRVEAVDKAFLVKDVNGIVLARIDYSETFSPSLEEAQTMAENMVAAATTVGALKP